MMNSVSRNVIHGTVGVYGDSFRDIFFIFGAAVQLSEINRKIFHILPVRHV